MTKDFVLLTGATGMVGFKVLTYLLVAGYRVRAAVRTQAGFDRISASKTILPYTSLLECIIVPDIITPGAYDEAVKGTKHIVHIASPLSANLEETGEYETTIIQPAIRGTVGIIESAMKEQGITKLVITSSVSSLASIAALVSGIKVDEETREAKTDGPFASNFFAYEAAKALAFQATENIVANRKPAFDVVTIHPALILGRDDNAQQLQDIAKGTNRIITGPLMGRSIPRPIPGITVHLDDVAQLHVMALDAKIEGNQSFIAAGPNYGSVNWSDAVDIIKRRYPEEYAANAFQFDSCTPTQTLAAKVDNTKASETFNLKFKTFEEQIMSVVDQFLELSKDATLENEQ